MKIVYESKFLALLKKLHLFPKDYWSVTIAEWVLTSRSDLSIFSIKHETKHVHQWRWHLYIFYPLVYYVIMIFTGYWNHPYEKAARRYAGQEDENGNLIPGTYGYND